VATLLIIGIIVVAGIFLYFMTVNLMQENQPEEVDFGVISVEGFYEGGGGWNFYNTHAYYVSHETTSWDRAYLRCQEMGGHLVTFEAEHEEEWVKQLVREKVGDVQFFVGLYQEPDAQEPNRGWKWVTGEVMGYINWASGEPNNAPDEDVGVDTSSGWDDVPGEWEKHFVCERLPVGFTLTNKTHRPIRMKDVTIKLYYVGNANLKTLLYSGGIEDGNIEVSMGGGIVSLPIVRWRCTRDVVEPGETVTCRAAALPLEIFSFGPFRVCVEVEHLRACDEFGYGRK